MRTSDRAGREINHRYEALEILGRGGQGIVYRAHDRWTKREVAIKVLASKAAREPEVAERLIREQRALSALKGTSAVEVLDICRGNDGELCLVMELLLGTDLDSYLCSAEERGERVSPKRVAEMFDPIVDTLETAHNAGILHRDLKPANIFLLDGGGVRLLDFGMARLRNAAPLTAAGTVMGSPSFMAPEAWRGQSEYVDHRADVYSLGVVLFRVLAGDLPFKGTSLHQKFLGTTRAERPSLLARRPDLPRHVDDWVATALAIDREHRFHNVRALWNSFHSAFDLESRRRVKRAASVWAFAKQALKRVAGSPVERSESDEESRARREPSYATKALARSVSMADVPLVGPAVSPPPLPEKQAGPTREATIELTGGDLRRMPPPVRR